MIDKLKPIAEFLGNLTLARVLLGLGLATGGVVLFAMWEARMSWAPMIWQSQTLIAVLGVGGVLIAIGGAINSLQHRLDHRTDALYAQMRDQIAGLQEQISAGKSEREAMMQRIVDLTISEERCQLQMESLRRELHSYAGGRRATDA